MTWFKNKTLIKGRGTNADDYKYDYVKVELLGVGPSNYVSPWGGRSKVYLIKFDDGTMKEVESEELIFDKDSRKLFCE